MCLSIKPLELPLAFLAFLPIVVLLVATASIQDENPHGEMVRLEPLQDVERCNPFVELARRRFGHNRNVDDIRQPPPNLPNPS